jgi:hypothetical protein
MFEEFVDHVDIKLNQILQYKQKQTIVLHVVEIHFRQNVC